MPSRQSRGLLHIGLAFHLAHSDAADHDVDMDVSRMVVPIRVSADDGRMTGEVFFAEFQAKCLCLFHGQPVVGCISGVKADDILVAFDITMLGILTILAVCQQAGCCKREIAALKGIEQVGFPQLRSALFIQKLLSSERIMLVNEVRFDGGVVRSFYYNSIIQIVGNNIELYVANMRFMVEPCSCPCD